MKKNTNGTAKFNSNSTSKSEHILIVDDNVILLRTVKDMLEEKYSVAISTSSTQAFEAIVMKKPDLILLDYEMPYVDGAEVMVQLQENNDTKDIPVVFFTSSAEREIVTKLIKLNPAGYLLKPPNKQKLLELIEKILSKETVDLDLDLGLSVDVKL